MRTKQNPPLSEDDTGLRPPDAVMRLARLGSFHQSRLSFMRVLLRRLKAARWRFDRPLWRIDAQGVGVASYRALGPDRTYTLVCFAHDLPAHLRSDRVIAEAWDATFTLFDGEPDEADLDRLAANVPKQEAGRVSDSELVLSRANRSVRIFEHVVNRLAAGRQPDAALVESVGYLMRTTAVYGSGKFGAADREKWSARVEFLGSFQPELLSVWLVRQFTVDLVEHLAHARSPQTAARLAPGLRRRLGVGNSTGLGMAPFLITHPLLLHNWVSARERALARVCGEQAASARARARFSELLQRARRNAECWSCEHPIQRPKVASLRTDLALAQDFLDNGVLAGCWPWRVLYRWAECTLGLEAQEQIVSLMLEPYPELVDELAPGMCADEAAAFAIDGSMPLGQVRRLLEDTYAWALDIDFESPAAVARVWYVSEEKLEPRLGERFEEPIEAYEQALAPGRDAKALHVALAKWPDETSVAALLLAAPEHRHTVRRLQQVASAPYAEIRDNTIGADMLPIDMLRCKLSFFGATRFDPRSDRWVRITMYQGAPFPDELADCDPDDLAYPRLDASSAHGQARAVGNDSRAAGHR